MVAPPRGERGLKYWLRDIRGLIDGVAPPRGERGLKCLTELEIFLPAKVAPPRGERGLKCISPAFARAAIKSLPLVGSVD